MAKDPAFLFYPGDWISGTMYMTFEEKGIYMELLMIQFNRGSFPEDVIKRILNVRYEAVWPTLKDKFNIDESGNYYNNRLREETNKRKKFTESRRDSRLKSDEDNVKIYIILDSDTRYYKIGSSVNPLRRFSEMCNQKNPAITVGNRNYELVWTSGVVKRNEETVLHKLFEKQRITGEWFSLTEDDLIQIKKRYELTYVQRTENENINSIKRGVVGEKNKRAKQIDIEKEIAVFSDGSTQELGPEQKRSLKEGTLEPHYIRFGKIE